MAAQGVEPEEIKRRLEAVVPKVNASFVIDQLDYLAKGGRCSAVTAQGAKILKLKPCIEVRDGEMVVGRKFRGNFDKAITGYAKKRLETEGIDPSRIFITHAGCAPETVDMIRDIVEESGEFQEIHITEAGCTISSHCGPNTLVFCSRNCKDGIQDVGSDRTGSFPPMFRCSDDRSLAAQYVCGRGE